MKTLFTFLLAPYICSLVAGGGAESNITALSSPKADTLFLSNDDLGKLIATTWEKRKRRPVILFLSQEELERMAQDPRYRWCEEKKRWARRYRR